MRLTDWLVPVYNAALFVREATRQGVDRRQLIKGTGFSLKDLEDSDTLKTYDQIVALIENARRLCPLPGLGLRVGRDQSPTQWGILGYAMMCCKTVRHMMAMLIKYHRIAASMAEFYFREERELAYLEIRPPRALHDALETVVEEHFSSIMSAVRSSLPAGSTSVRRSCACRMPRPGMRACTGRSSVVPVPSAARRTRSCSTRSG